MLRYHKQVYFPVDKQKDLELFAQALNTLSWHITAHVKAELIRKGLLQQDFLQFIRDYQAKIDDCFEFYYDETKKEIIECVYRVSYDKRQDVILCVSKDKSLITVYLNDKEDNHCTLKKYIYQTI